MADSHRPPREYKHKPFIRKHPFNVMMRENRLARNMSYKTLSEAIGSGSKSYLSDIEVGKYAVSTELGLAICQVLEIPPHLCIDYICVVEQERIKNEIKNSYKEWLDYIPDNVKDKMLSDETSRQLHHILMEENYGEQI